MAQKSVSDQITQLMEQYGKEFAAEVNRAIDEVAKESVQKLKATSPQGPEGYANNWRKRKQASRRSTGIATTTVHNGGDTYRLTHLLENSHVIRNKKGTYGRTSPGHGQHIHIAPVEEWANEEVIKRIKEALSR